MKLFKLLTLLLLFSAFPAFAQDAAPEARRHPLQILETTVTVTDGSPTLSVRGVITGDCGSPQVEILENADDLVVIDVYTESAEGVECDAVEPEQTVEISLDTDIPDTGLTLDINGVAYIVNPDGSFGAAFVAPLLITELSAVVEDDTLVLSVTGEMDGCDVPVIVRQTVENGAVNLRLYRILSAAMACPMILVQYTNDIEIPLTGDEGGLWVISANDREVGYDFDRDTSVAGEDLTRMDATIESVEVNAGTPLPQQVTITVTGYHPDGCRVPTQVRQQFDVINNTLNVHIYRVVPIDVMCPAVIENFTLTIPLEIAISEGVSYTINVNGTLVVAEF
jgi:hypothetical protein